MSFSIRRLLPGDAAALLAYEAVSARFEHEVAHEIDLETAAEPPDPQRIAPFLADPTVLFWLAERNGSPVGMLHCYVQRRYAPSAWAELLLYEIGTHADHRRQGIGRALLDAMEDWMRATAIDVVWVPAAATAIAFYEACGYIVDGDSDRVMSKTLV